MEGKRSLVKNYFLIVMHIAAVVMAGLAFFEPQAWMSIPILAVSALGVFGFFWHIEILSEGFWKCFLPAWLIWSALMVAGMVLVMPGSLLPLGICALAALCAPVARALYCYGHERYFVSGR